MARRKATARSAVDETRSAHVAQLSEEKEPTSAGPKMTAAKKRAAAPDGKEDGAPAPKKAKLASAGSDDCTCGSCLRGKLSPKIKMQLQLHADHIYTTGIDAALDLMDEALMAQDNDWDLEGAGPYKKLYRDFLFSEYLPGNLRALREGVELNVVMGYYQSFKLVSRLLDDGKVPDSILLLREAALSQDDELCFMREYFQSVGDLYAMEYIVKAVIKRAEHNEDDVVDDKELKKLPACMNDGRGWKFVLNTLV